MMGAQGDAQLGACVLEVVRRWTFPQPDGGSVAVHYPFWFSPE